MTAAVAGQRNQNPNAHFIKSTQQEVINTENQSLRAICFRGLRQTFCFNRTLWFDGIL